MNDWILKVILNTKDKTIYKKLKNHNFIFTENQLSNPYLRYRRRVYKCNKCNLHFKIHMKGFFDCQIYYINNFNKYIYILFFNNINLSKLKLVGIQTNNISYKNNGLDDLLNWIDNEKCNIRIMRSACE